MPTNITYKGSILTTVNNEQAKVLKTSGKYLEDDITISSALNLQGKTTSITPNTSTQTTTISPDSGYEGLSGVTITINPIPSQYIIPAGTITITSNGTHDVSQYADAEVNISTVNNQNKTVVPSETTQSITADTGYSGLGTVTVNGITNTYVGSGINRQPPSNVAISYNSSSDRLNIYVPTGYYESTDSVVKRVDLILPTQSTTTIIPSESAQTAVDIHKWTTGTVTVAAITSTYVGSGVTTNPSITVSGPSVTIPAGYYSSQQTKTVASGSVDLGIEATVEALPTITVSASGLITALNNSTGQVEIEVNPGYISGNTTGTIGIAGEATRQLSTQGATTVTPSTATQTINVTGKYMTGNVTVNPIPSQYIVPSGTYIISSVDSTNTFNVTNYASVAVNLKNADVTAY